MAYAAAPEPQKPSGACAYRVPNVCDCSCTQPDGTAYLLCPVSLALAMPQAFEPSHDDRLHLCVSSRVCSPAHGRCKPGPRDCHRTCCWEQCRRGGWRPHGGRCTPALCACRSVLSTRNPTKSCHAFASLLQGLHGITVHRTIHGVLMHDVLMRAPCCCKDCMVSQYTDTQSHSAASHTVVGSCSLCGTMAPGTGALWPCSCLSCHPCGSVCAHCVGMCRLCPQESKVAQARMLPYQPVWPAGQVSHMQSKAP